jgi:hypothetical protein
MTATGLAISAAAPATTYAENFECDLALNQVQVSANTYSSQDSFKQWNNVALSGKNKPLIASYDTDQNAFQRQSKLTAAFDDQMLAMGLPMIRKMIGVESRPSSEHNDSDLRFCAIY